MLKHPNKRQFRGMVLTAFFLYIVTLIVGVTQIDQNSQEIRDAVSWTGYGTIFSDQTYFIIVLAMALAFLVGQIGLLLFKPWSRQLLLCTILTEILLSTCLGLNIFTGWTMSLVTLCGIFTYVPLTLSLFEPCSLYFSSASKTASAEQDAAPNLRPR